MKRRNFKVASVSGFEEWVLFQQRELEIVMKNGSNMENWKVNEVNIMSQPETHFALSVQSVLRWLTLGSASLLSGRL